MLGIIVSTGVGGGIVADGRLMHGATGQAGHIGHLIVMPEGAPLPMRGAGLSHRLRVRDRSGCAGRG